MVIGFIGLGNMASAMVRGIAAAQLEGVTLCGHNPHPEKARELTEQCGLRLLPSNQAVLDTSDVVVLAVKPQILDGVLAELTPPADRLFISVAAGKDLAWLEARLGQASIIRVAPNINAVVGASVTGWCANDAVSDDQKALTATLLGTFGTAVEVPEKFMGIVSAIGGGGAGRYAQGYGGGDRRRYGGGQRPHGAPVRPAPVGAGRPGHIPRRHHGRGAAGAPAWRLRVRRSRGGAGRAGKG